MPRINDLIQRSVITKAPLESSPRDPLPSSQVVVVTCMDTRINPYALLNVKAGEIHLLRNAGGIVTEDVIRSLIISQRKLNTCEVLVIQHTDCGMMKFTDSELQAQLSNESNSDVHLKFHTFTDLRRSVKESVQKILEHPLLSSTAVQGCIYDVHSQELERIE